MVKDIHTLLKDNTMDEPMADALYLWDLDKEDLPAGVSYRSGGDPEP